MDILPPLFSLENHQGYFRMEISLIFPSKFQSVIKAIQRVPVVKKISQWCFTVNSLVNWKVYRFGEISLIFQPRILGEIEGMFLQGNFQTVLCSLQRTIRVDKSTCLSSSSKFHRKQHDSVSDLIHFLLIVDIRWILPGFPCFWGYQVDASPKFSPFPYPCARSAPFLYEQLDFR